MSSLEDPISPGIFLDAISRSDISGNPPHHSENKFFQCDTKGSRFQYFGLPHWMMFAGYRWLPLAAEIQGVFGSCDCGGNVVVVAVEAVSPRGVVDRRVLTAHVHVIGVDSARRPNSTFAGGVVKGFS